MDQAVIVSVTIFGAGIIFYAGMLAQRVTSLEKWREEVNAKFDSIHDAIRRVERLIVNGHE